MEFLRKTREDIPFEDEETRCKFNYKIVENLRVSVETYILAVWYKKTEILVMLFGPVGFLVGRGSVFPVIVYEMHTKVK